MSDKNLVNAGSAKSRNLDREFVTAVVRSYCRAGGSCLVYEVLRCSGV